MTDSAINLARSCVSNGFNPLPVPYGEKAPRLREWQEIDLTAATVDQFFSDAPANIGFLTRRTPVIDIDVTDPNLAMRIEAEAEKRFPGALRRVGQAPKVALFLRCEQPFGKLKTAKYQLGDGKVGQVEIMCNGQQVIGFGRHPSDCDYTWEGPSPADTSWEDLPVIDEAAARDFREWVEDLLASAAGVATPKPAPQRAQVFSFDTGQRFDSAPVSLDEAAEIVGHIDPDITHDEWVSVLQGLHAEFGDAALPLAVGWSARGSKFKPSEVERRWQGFNPAGGVGFGTVCALARTHGADLSAIAKRHRSARQDQSDPKVPERKGYSAELALKPTRFTPRDPSLIPPRQWLYDKHLISSFVSLTVSPGGIGKSSLLMTEALAMAANKPLLGMCPPRPLRVWLWNGEDPVEELERRIAAACLHYELTEHDLGGRLFMDSGRNVPIKLAVTQGGVIIARPVIEALIAAIRENAIDVLVIDPFVTSHGVTENDNNEIDLVVSLWREIADRTGCAIELVHHAVKAALSSGNELGIAQSRGGSALIDGVRSARYLVAMSETEAERAGVDSRHGFFRVETGKANLAPRVDKATWRQMVGVALNNGAGLYPEGDFVGVATEWKMPDAFDGLSVCDLENVKRRVASAQWRESDQSNEWVGYAIAEVLGLEIGPRKKAERTADQTKARARVRQLLGGWLHSGELVREKSYSARDGREVPCIVVGRGVE